MLKKKETREKVSVLGMVVHASDLSTWVLLDGGGFRAKDYLKQPPQWQQQKFLYFTSILSPNQMSQLQTKHTSICFILNNGTQF
jgi:hypothetical protein